jgi:hypothetical protein
LHNNLCHQSNNYCMVIFIQLFNDSSLRVLLLQLIFFSAKKWVHKLWELSQVDVSKVLNVLDKVPPPKAHFAS